MKFLTDHESLLMKQKRSSFSELSTPPLKHPHRSRSSDNKTSNQTTAKERRVDSDMDSTARFERTRKDDSDDDDDGDGDKKDNLSLLREDDTVATKNSSEFEDWVQHYT